MGRPGAFIAHQILRLPKGGLWARYLTFIISGLIHAAADIAGGIPFENQGMIRFFVTQAFDITIEDTVEALYHFSYKNDIKRSLAPG